MFSHTASNCLNSATKQLHIWTNFGLVFRTKHDLAMLLLIMILVMAWENWHLKPAFVLAVWVLCFGSFLVKAPKCRIHCALWALGAWQHILYFFWHLNHFWPFRTISGLFWPIWDHFLHIQKNQKSPHRCTSLTWLSGKSCITCITCIISTTEISHRRISWDIVDIAGIRVPQKYLANLFREISLT